MLIAKLRTMLIIKKKDENWQKSAEIEIKN